MMKKFFIAVAMIAAVAAVDVVAVDCGTEGVSCAAAGNDRNSDGYIYKGTVMLTRVGSGRQERFCLFEKGGVEYVSTSRRGPYYRLARRMTINNVDYTY